VGKASEIHDPQTVGLKALDFETIRKHIGHQRGLERGRRDPSKGRRSKDGQGMLRANCLLGPKSSGLAVVKNGPQEGLHVFV